MHTTNLRKVGGSVMLAVPPALLDVLQLKAGATVGLAVNDNYLLVKPKPQIKKRYTLDELLAQCDPHAEISDEDQAWLDLKPAGNEIPT